MATVGELNARLTANDNGFQAALNTGATQVEKLGGTFNKNQGAFINFNAKMLESRRALGTLAATLGTSVGPILHLTHAFGTFGITAGAAAASIMVLREAFSGLALDQQKFNAENKKFVEFEKQLRHFITGKEETAAEKELDAIGTHITEVKKQQL